MKTSRLVSLGLIASLLVALTPLRLTAADASAAATGLSGSRQELAAVEQFLHLSDAQLDEMLQVIRRIRAMTPEQRAALHAEIAAFRQLPEPERRQLRQGWGQMSRELRDGWRQMMQAATPERRDEIHARLQTLAPEEKNAYRQKLVEEFQQAGRDRK
jgi:hypothetical protein